MPLYRRVTATERFSTVTSLIEANVQIQSDGGAEKFTRHFPIEGEIIQSFEAGESPGGWHLVWLDQAFEYEDQTYAYLMIAARWVARPLTRGQVVPISIRFVPDVGLVQKDTLEVEKLPLAGKGVAILL